MTPSPHRLFLIGAELDKLNAQIAELTPPSIGGGAAAPDNGARDKMARNLARKEKNKLASRACRLKKKAQHEANKLVLFGLEQEHGSLTTVLKSIRADLLFALNHPERRPSLSSRLERLLRDKSLLDPNDWVAGNASDFVNRVLERVEGGDTCGGLPTQAVASSSAMDLDDD